MTTIQIELPDATALAARDAGLLTPQAMERLINDALRRKQAACLLGIVDCVANHAEPHVEHEDVNQRKEAGHGEEV